jgi:gamma-glutamylcyclotransferase (GGCT)/AIG2-like uncharacterized protein YtfP
MNLFFYGTLMDAEVRELVCGRTLDAVEPAIAQGFRRVFVAGRHYPMLLPHASGWVEGTLVTGVDPLTVHRLQVYEGWEYSLQPLKVRASSGHMVMAHVFLCPPTIAPNKRHWRLDEWQRRHKRTFLPKARQLMDRALKTGRMPVGVSGQRPRPGLAPRVVRK